MKQSTCLFLPLTLLVALSAVVPIAKGDSSSTDETEQVEPWDLSWMDYWNFGTVHSYFSTRAGMFANAVDPQSPTENGAQLSRSSLTSAFGTSGVASPVESIDAASGTTVTYTMSTGNLSATANTGQGSSNVGVFNSGSPAGVGLYAHDISGQLVRQVGFERFTTDGSGQSTAARNLQVGDQFQISMKMPNATFASTPGIYFNDSTDYSSHDKYNTGNRFSITLGSDGKWYLNQNGTSTYVNVNAGTDVTVQVTITSSNTFNVNINNGTFTATDLTMSGSPSTNAFIQSFALVNQNDKGSGNDLIAYSGSLTDTGLLSVGGTTDRTISGVIRDGLAANSTSAVTANKVVKTGSGTLTLTGDNTYTDGTEINAGALVLGSAGAISNTGAVKFGGGTLQFTASNTADYSSRIANSGSAIRIDTSGQNLTFASGLASTNVGGLTKLGLGTLTLAGANEYTGATTITGGTLAIAGIGNAGAAGSLGQSSNAASNLVFDGGTLLYTGAGASTDRSFTINAGKTAFVDVSSAGTNLTISGGSASTAGALTKLGSGTLTLGGANQHSGVTLVDAGTLALGGAGSFASGARVNVASGATFDVSGITGTSTTVGILSEKQPGSGGSVRLGDKNLTVSGGAAGSYFFRNLGLSGDSGSFTLNSSGTTLGLYDASLYSGSTTLSAGTLLVGSSMASTAYSLSGGNLTTNSGANLADAAIVSISSGTFTVGATDTIGNISGTSGTISIGQGFNLTTTVSSDSTFSGVISGDGSLTKNGGAVLTLGGNLANTFLGTTTVNAGTLILAKNGVNALAGTPTINSGGAIRLGASNQFSGDSTFLTVNSGGLFDLAGFNETLAITGIGSITLGTGTLTINPTQTDTFGGVISGSGAVVKTNSGTQILSGPNTYNGGTTINGGVLSINAANSLGDTSGGLTINSGTLQATATFSTLRAWTLNSALSTVEVTGANTLSLANGTSSAAGTGSLTKTGSGTLQLDTAATYSGGATNIQNGTVRLGTESALPAGTAVTLGSGSSSGVLDLNGKSEALNGLTTSGTGVSNRIVNNNATAGLLTLNIASSNTFSGILGNAGQDNFSLTKAGAGTLVLSGSNTFSGNINVDAGVLSVAADTNLGAAGKTIALNSGTTFRNTANLASSQRVFDISTAANAVVSFDQSSGADLSFNSNGSGGISGGSASATIVKTGTGALNVGNNSKGVSGTWRVDQGTLETLTDSGLGNAGNDITLNGGTFRYSGTTGTLALGSGRVITVNSVAGNIIRTGGGVLSLGTVNQLTGAGAVSLGVNGGSSVLSIGASNNYSGVFTVASGSTLIVGADNALGTGSLVINPGSSVGANVRASDNTARSLAGTNLSIADTGVVTFGDTTASPSGTGNLTFGSLTLTGNRTVNVANSGSNVTIGALDYVVTTGRTLTLSGAGDFTISGNILNAGTGGDVLSQTGTGVLSVNGDNTGSSANLLYRISNGTISMNSANAFGNSYADKFNFDGNSTLRATNSFAIGTTGTGSFSINNGSTATFNVLNSSDVLTIAGNIAQNAGSSNTGKTGNGALTKTGAGTLVLSGANSYSGATNINGGTLSVIANNNLGSTITAAGIGFNGGTLSIGGTSTSFSSSRAITLNGAGTLDSGAASNSMTFLSGSTVSNGSNLLTLRGSGTGVLQGSIASGGGGLTKNGTGTWTLSGSNNFGGATAIDQGTLTVSANGALGSGTVGTSAIAVNNGGTLMLTNFSATDRIRNDAPITMAGGTLGRTGGGTVSEGAAGSRSGSTFTNTGTSTVGLGALTLTANSTFDFNLLNTGGVGTFVFSTFTSQSNAVLNIVNWSSNAYAPSNVSGIDGQDTRLVFNQDQSGNLQYFSFNGTPASQIDLGGGYFEVTPVPEPSTYAAGFLAFAAIGFSQRRRIARLLKRRPAAT
jgi:fibronectin-binding autotransporter adhesin